MKIVYSKNYHQTCWKYQCLNPVLYIISFTKKEFSKKNRGYFKPEENYPDGKRIYTCVCTSHLIEYLHIIGKDKLVEHLVFEAL